MGAGTNIDITLAELIRAACADYERRASLICAGCMPRRVDMELRYLNFKIYDAAAMVVGKEEAQRFIYEIGRKVGYVKSSFSYLSESTYKIYKREVVENIAKSLYLVSG